MAAIAFPDSSRRPRPHLRLVGPDTARRRVPSRRVAYRRRRLLALVGLAIFVLALQPAVHAASAWLGGGSLTASEPRPSAAPAGSVYVVQPGDTLWSLARRSHPSGDLRPIVGRLSTALAGQPLRAGQRIIVP